MKNLNLNIFNSLKNNLLKKQAVSFRIGKNTDNILSFMNEYSNFIETKTNVDNIKLNKSEFLNLILDNYVEKFQENLKSIDLTNDDQNSLLLKEFLIDYLNKKDLNQEEIDIVLNDFIKNKDINQILYIDKNLIVNNKIGVVDEHNFYIVKKGNIVNNFKNSNVLYPLLSDYVIENKNHFIFELHNDYLFNNIENYIKKNIGCIILDYSDNNQLKNQFNLLIKKYKKEDISHQIDFKEDNLEKFLNCNFDTPDELTILYHSMIENKGDNAFWAGRLLILLKSIFTILLSLEKINILFNTKGEYVENFSFNIFEEYFDLNHLVNLYWTLYIAHENPENDIFQQHYKEFYKDDSIPKKFNERRLPDYIFKSKVEIKLSDNREEDLKMKRKMFQNSYIKNEQEYYGINLSYLSNFIQSLYLNSTNSKKVSLKNYELYYSALDILNNPKYGKQSLTNLFKRIKLLDDLLYELKDFQFIFDHNGEKVYNITQELFLTYLEPHNNIILTGFLYYLLTEDYYDGEYLYSYKEITINKSFYLNFQQKELDIVHKFVKQFKNNEKFKNKLLLLKDLSIKILLNPVEIEKENYEKDLLKFIQYQNFKELNLFSLGNIYDINNENNQNLKLTKYEIIQPLPYQDFVEKYKDYGMMMYKNIEELHYKIFGNTFLIFNESVDLLLNKYKNFFNQNKDNTIHIENIIQHSQYLYLSLPKNILENKELQKITNFIITLIQLKIDKLNLSQDSVFKMIFNDLKPFNNEEIKNFVYKNYKLNLEFYIKNCDLITDQTLNQLKYQDNCYIILENNEESIENINNFLIKIDIKLKDIHNLNHKQGYFICNNQSYPFVIE